VIIRRRFEGFGGGFFSPVADYPTLAPAAH
jgi:hypothetical protein